VAATSRRLRAAFGFSIDNKAEYRLENRVVSATCRSSHQAAAVTHTVIGAGGLPPPVSQGTATSSRSSAGTGRQPELAAGLRSRSASWRQAGRT
jgi:hypothetical protein